MAVGYEIEPLQKIMWYLLYLLFQIIFGHDYEGSTQQMKIVSYGPVF